MEVSSDPDIGVDVSGCGITCSVGVLIAQLGAFFLGFAFEGEHITRGYGWNEGVFFFCICFLCRLSNFSINLLRPTKR